ncbi:hypothetical protein WMY93_002592 [Mugilogobius chulae]|uniref:Uncharacterized protein n=1 Tax=Mugilogobius chulae TaxID=88201 RepID=A0AAW0PU87_9GOBI
MVSWRPIVVGRYCLHGTRERSACTRAEKHTDRGFLVVVVVLMLLLYCNRKLDEKSWRRRWSRRRRRESAEEGGGHSSSSNSSSSQQAYSSTKHVVSFPPYGLFTSRLAQKQTGHRKQSRVHLDLTVMCLQSSPGPDCDVSPEVHLDLTVTCLQSSPGPDCDVSPEVHLDLTVTCLKSSPGPDCDVPRVHLDLTVTCLQSSPGPDCDVSPPDLTVVSRSSPGPDCGLPDWCLQSSYLTGPDTGLTVVSRVHLDLTSSPGPDCDVSPEVHLDLTVTCLQSSPGPDCDVSPEVHLDLTVMCLHLDLTVTCLQSSPGPDCDVSRVHLLHWELTRIYLESSLGPTGLVCNPRREVTKEIENSFQANGATAEEFSRVSSLPFIHVINEKLCSEGVTYTTPCPNLATETESHSLTTHTNRTV